VFDTENARDHRGAGIWPSNRGQSLPKGCSRHEKRNRQGTAVSKVTVVYTPGQFEQMAASLADLGREDLKKRIKDFRGRFKLDFSDDYLDALSLDRLRHLLLAALINAKAER
jgi:hypothetical protein